MREVGSGDHPAINENSSQQIGLNKLQSKKSTKSSIFKDQPQFITQDVQLEDKRCVKFLKAPDLTQSTEHQRINLEEYQDQKWDQEVSTMSTTEPQEEDWD